MHLRFEGWCVSWKLDIYWGELLDNSNEIKNRGKEPSAGHLGRGKAENMARLMIQLLGQSTPGDYFNDMASEPARHMLAEHFADSIETIRI